MNCRILKTLYVKANQEIVCDDDIGARISLGRIELSDKWSIDDVFNNEKYQQIRKALKNGFPPWIDICSNCALFNIGELYEENLDKKIRIQIEPSLLCNLECLCCSRSQEIKQRPEPHLMNLRVFERILESCLEKGYTVTEFEFAGNGEPLSHPDFREFPKLARSIMPVSKQTLVTNGNYDYHRTLNDTYIDEIFVACDGLYQTNYEKYRVNGSVTKALQFMSDAKSLRLNKKPFITWKYILFEFNDSDEELIASQRKAEELGVDRLLFVITKTPYKSKRFSVNNIDDIPLISSLAYVNPMPILARNDRTGVLLKKSKSLLSFLLGQKKTFCIIDKIFLSNNMLLTIEGWAMGKNGGSVKAITVYCDNEKTGNAQTGLSRPDVLNAFPELKNDKCGFSLMKRLNTTLKSPTKVTLKIETNKWMSMKFISWYIFE